MATATRSANALTGDVRPGGHCWRKLRDEAAGCTRCDLYERATQTILAERAAIALAGEQPGEQEHKQVRELTGTV
jgi:DNA polymerase